MIHPKAVRYHYVRLALKTGLFLSYSRKDFVKIFLDAMYSYQTSRVYSPVCHAAGAPIRHIRNAKAGCRRAQLTLPMTKKEQDAPHSVQSRPAAFFRLSAGDSFLNLANSLADTD